MSIISQYSYPSRDILTIGWSGVTNDTTKYVNIDEGVSSPNYNDYICKSGLMSQINGRHSFQFGTNPLHVLPSSVFLNINVSASSSNILSTGDLWLERALLLDSNSGVIAQYEYKSAGEPTYSWALSSDFSTKNVIMSGFTTNSAYFNDTICDIRLSGNFSAFVSLSDNFKVSVSAFEFLSSGVVGVDFSGMPLFITGPRIVSECLTVINASGAPISTAPSGFWWNELGNHPENSTTWWQSVSGGIHTPNDLSHVYSFPQAFYEHPAGVSGLGAEAAAWSHTDGTLLALGTTAWEINSGVVTPEDTTWWRYGATDTNYYTPSPQILFNKPGNFSYDIGVAVRAARFSTDDTMTLRNVVLKNSTGSTLATWPDDQIYLGALGGGSVADSYSTRVTVSDSLWTSRSNYLTFDVYQHFSGITPSGYARFYEIDLYGGTLNSISPNFYFKKPTLSNADAGASMCFRVQNVNGAPLASVTLSDITWEAKNPGPVFMSTFEDITLTNVPVSSFQNYCVRSLDPIVNLSTANFNFMYFTSTVPSGQNLADVLFSEFELCCSGLDPVSSGYIPLYINANSSSNSGIPLYEGGHIPVNSGMSLYEYGHDSKNSGIPLYLNGNDSSNSGIPLYIAGPIPINSGLSLSIWGHSTSSSGLSLYIAGPIPQSSWMPLFLKAETIPGINGSIPLFTYSTTNSGLFKTLPLYIGGSGDTNTSMPLYLMGPEHADISSNMILFLKGIGNLDGSLTVSSGIPMFLKNGWVAQNSGINLYVKTQEGTMGAIPVSSWMSLFINREFNSTANNVPLYLKVADVGSGNIPMYVKGTYVMESGIPLVISNVYTSSTLSLQMYTHAH